MKKVLVLHGPNLHYLGKREPSIYGSLTLKELNQLLVEKAKSLKLNVYMDQSNSEGHLIDLIYEAKAQAVDLVIFNPAGYTHTSIAIRDAILAIEVPLIEVHLSNIYKREAFRHHSYFSDIAIGTISGFGPESYVLAMDAAENYLSNKDKS